MSRRFQKREHIETPTFKIQEIRQFVFADSLLKLGHLRNPNTWKPSRDIRRNVWNVLAEKIYLRLANCFKLKEILQDLKLVSSGKFGSAINIYGSFIEEQFFVLLP